MYQSSSSQFSRTTNGKELGPDAFDESRLAMTILKSDSHLAKKFVLSSFRSQDIQVFDLNFWSCRKNGLIRKKKLS